MGRLVASWKYLGASEDRNYCFLKVKSLEILIFEGFHQVLGRSGRGRHLSRAQISAPLRGRKYSVRRYKCVSEEVIE